MTNFMTRAFSSLRTASFVALAVLLAVGFYVFAVQAATLTVCPIGCGFTSIQAAINAASNGDTINVGPATYVEQLVITKKLNLLGAGSATTIIDAPGVLATETDGDGTSIVEISGAIAKVTMSGFTVQGPLGAITSAIHVHGNADVKIQNNKVIGTDALTGTLQGYGIDIGSTFVDDDTPAKALITDNELSGFHRAGIAVLGTGNKADVKNNTLTGGGATALTTQQGITSQEAAAGDVLNNTVRNMEFTGAAPQTAVGVFLWDAAKSIDVETNTLEDLQTGVMVQATEKVDIVGNHITDLAGGAVADFGIWVLGRGAASTNCAGGDGVTPGLGCATDVKIDGNTITGDGTGTGVFIGKTPELPFTPAMTTAKVKSNTISGWTYGLIVGPAGTVNASGSVL